MAKLEPYDRQLSYSYALGVFPCLQLLSARPKTARRLLLHPEGLESEGVALLIGDAKESLAKLKEML